MEEMKDRLKIAQKKTKSWWLAARCVGRSTRLRTSTYIYTQTKRALDESLWMLSRRSQLSTACICLASTPSRARVFSSLLDNLKVLEFIFLPGVAVVGVIQKEQ